jgi:hypothetical protein
MFIAKNRNGPDGIVFPMQIDTSKVKLKVLPSQSNSGGLDSIVSKTQKEQQEHLRKKYKKYKSNKMHRQEKNQQTKNESLSREAFRELAQSQKSQPS